MHLIVFSHLRWNFVYQRPQHLLSRFARSQKVIFWEEPEFHDGVEAQLRVTNPENLLTVVVPELPSGISEQECWAMQQNLLTEFISEQQIRKYTTWYYTPMALHFSGELNPSVVVYDCMDELSAFRGAPPGIVKAEAELFGIADLVFTGGRSIYEKKKLQHPSVHLFPSSIDFSHLAAARTHKKDPIDQKNVPRPRIGYCGVIDERMDLDLLDRTAELRSNWQFVMVGPVVKIGEADLPRRENIHYLGSKTYKELPEYMSGWDIGMLPFARNESTRYISPTKTPEYLAAGLPVISTSITDVVRPYGEAGLVVIADTPQELIGAAEEMLRSDGFRDAQRLQLVDKFLAQSSWDRTFAEMRKLIFEVASQQSGAPLSGGAETTSGSSIAVSD